MFGCNGELAASYRPLLFRIRSRCPPCCGDFSMIRCRSWQQLCYRHTLYLMLDQDSRPHSSATTCTMLSRITWPNPPHLPGLSSAGLVLRQAKRRALPTRGDQPSEPHPTVKPEVTFSRQTKPKTSNGGEVKALRLSCRCMVETPLLARESTTNNTRRGVVSWSQGGHYKVSQDEKHLHSCY